MNAENKVILDFIAYPRFLTEALGKSLAKLLLTARESLRIGALFKPKDTTGLMLIMNRISTQVFHNYLLPYSDGSIIHYYDEIKNTNFIDYVLTLNHFNIIKDSVLVYYVSQIHLLFDLSSIVPISTLTDHESVMKKITTNSITSDIVKSYVELIMNELIHEYITETGKKFSRLIHRCADILEIHPTLVYMPLDDIEYHALKNSTDADIYWDYYRSIQYEIKCCTTNCVAHVLNHEALDELNTIDKTITTYAIKVTCEKLHLTVFTTAKILNVCK
jgi:hypothetical protein